MKTVLLISVIIVLLAACAAPASAQLPDSVQATVDRYRAAITLAESGTAPRAIEQAFAALDSMRAALMEDDGEESVLEQMSDQDFERLEQDLAGALINREETVFVMPDAAYFDSLATAHGDDADRGFFRALKATYSDGVWPVYNEEQTDYSGCSRFGSLAFVETYRTWRDFRKEYPARYAMPAEAEVEMVLDELTGSKCACGDLQSARKEFEEFIRRFPASPARRDVERRLAAIQSGKSDIRVNCTSG